MAPLLQQLPSMASPAGIAVLGLVAFVILLVGERYVFGMKYPAGVPLIREPEGATRFSLRTRLAFYIDCQALFREAYDNGKPVMIPGLGFRKELIMPPSAMRWVMAQPESRLSLGKAFAEVDQIHWSLGHDKYVVDAWQGGLVKTEMGRVLENLCEAMKGELHLAFDEHFGKDDENWKTVDITSAVRMIVAQASSRFTVGVPLCREKEYLNVVNTINDMLIANAGVSGAMPHFLRPVIGTLFNLPLRLKLASFRSFFMPYLESRLHVLQQATDNPKVEEPQDHFQMMLRYARDKRPEEFRDPESMMRRLVAQNFGAVHNTSIQVVNLLLNILGSDSEFNTIATLRAETDQILGAGGDAEMAWTKSTITQMFKADSVARETLRLNSFGGRAVWRIVMTDDVVTEDGYALPRGTLMSFLGQPAQTDPATTEDPLKFDPFRFSRQRGSSSGSDGHEKASPATAPQAFVTTSPEFLPFGHGKHACPGRFLIDFEFKMIMSYVVRHYDLKFPEEYGGKRPPNRWLAEAILPPVGTKILVKRRKL